MARHHQHVEGQDLVWSDNTGGSNVGFLSSGVTCNEFEVFVGKTAADLLELIFSNSLLLISIQFELSLINFSLHVVVSQFVRGEILQWLLDGREFR